MFGHTEKIQRYIKVTRSMCMLQYESSWSFFGCESGTLYSVQFTNSSKTLFYHSKLIVSYCFYEKSNDQQNLLKSNSLISFRRVRKVRTLLNKCYYVHTCKK